MVFSGEVLSALLAALGGLIGGATVSLEYAKRKLDKVINCSSLSGVDPEIVIGIFTGLNEAIEANDPGGEQITDEQAAKLGREVWRVVWKASLKKKG